MKLDHSREFELLVKSIEEASKHARNLLLALLVSGIYVVIAAYSGTPAGNLKLPVFGVDVQIAEFFAISPLVVFGIYMYMHIYIGELRVRLKLFDALPLECTFVSNRRVLLFPWLLTFSSSQKSVQVPHPDQGANNKSETSAPSLYTYIVSVFVIWLVGPLVLLMLWVRFVGQENPTSIIPCLCLVASLFSISAATGAGRWISVIAGAIGLGFITITVSSVPSFRSQLALDELWRVSQAFAPSLMNATKIVGMSTVYTVAILTAVGKLLDDVLNNRTRVAISEWLVEQWLKVSEVPGGTVLAMFVENAIDQRRMLQYTLFVSGIPFGIAVGLLRVAFV